MPVFPKLPTSETKREITDTFKGYNHRLKIKKGEFYDMMNLSSTNYPMLSCRKSRGLIRELKEPKAILAKEKLAYIDSGRLWYDGKETALQVSEGDKQMVSMGAYICIFPDKLFYNTADPTDHGSMEACYSSTGAVTCTLCKIDGSEYQSPRVADSPNTDPENGELWIDTSGDSDILKQWSSESQCWVEISSVYTRLRFVSQGELPVLFSASDGVEISGCEAEILNGSKIIQAIGGGEGEPDYIVVTGILRETVVQTEGCIKIQRTVPDMDFICESQNRLWGCRYGNDGEGNLNEIYGCALGDFKNWQQYQGLSTDSWTASVGSDGPWTGAVNYLGSPMFFKENTIHKVTVSSYGAHRITETVCRGVQPGSHGSLSVVNETLYYKSTKDICAYQGGFPVSVSEALGEENYFKAVAGSVGDKYYIAMDDKNAVRQLFVYDIGRSIWMKEDTLPVLGFARLESQLYAMTEDSLWCISGDEGKAESYVPWMAESGILYYQYPDKKYVSRINLRMSMEEGAWMDVFIQYDSSGLWESKGRIKLSGTGTVTVPICPRRCDHMQIRLEGKGNFKLFSMANILEIGSDM
jgi:hypothetical protein